MDCVLDGRTYRILMPPTKGLTTSPGAIVFMHGWRGSAAGIMRNQGLRTLASELGVALVAVKSAGPGWDLPNSPGRGPGRAVEFFDRLLPHLASAHGIDRRRIIASGFSAGGMVVWELTCRRPRMFAGFAPIAGTFWAPVPRDCREPRPPIVHIHGTSDQVVPIAGRPIGPGRQGDVREAIAMAAQLAVAPERRAAVASLPGEPAGLTCTEQGNQPRATLLLCLHAGGHRLDARHLRHAWRVFEASGALK